MTKDTTMKSAIIAAIALVATACVTGTVTEPSACKNFNLGTVPASPVAGIAVSGLAFSSNVDFSTVVGRVNDVATDVQATVNSLTVHSGTDMSWLHSATVSIAAQDSSMPPAQLAHYVFPGGTASDHIDLTVDMGAAELVAYIGHPATLTYVLSGTAPDQAAALDGTLCIAVSAKVSESL